MNDRRSHPRVPTSPCYHLFALTIMNESVPTRLLPPLLPRQIAGGNAGGNAQKTAIFSYLLPPSYKKEEKSMGGVVYKSVWRASEVETRGENVLAAPFRRNPMTARNLASEAEWGSCRAFRGWEGIC